MGLKTLTKNIKKMYKTPIIRNNSFDRNESKEGETIEMKIERIVNNKEPIKDGAPIIFTERKDGVLASYNIRTDRFDIAIDGMDKIQKSLSAKREERGKVRNLNEESNNGKPDNTHQTGGE